MSPEGSNDATDDERPDPEFMEAAVRESILYNQDRMLELILAEKLYSGSDEEPPNVHSVLIGIFAFAATQLGMDADDIDYDLEKAFRRVLGKRGIGHLLKNYLSPVTALAPAFLQAVKLDRERTVLEAGPKVVQRILMHSLDRLVTLFIAEKILGRNAGSKVDLPTVLAEAYGYAFIELGRREDDRDDPETLVKEGLDTVMSRTDLWLGKFPRPGAVLVEHFKQAAKDERVADEDRCSVNDE